MVPIREKDDRKIVYRWSDRISDRTVITEVILRTEDPGRHFALSCLTLVYLAEREVL